MSQHRISAILCSASLLAALHVATPTALAGDSAEKEKKLFNPQTQVNAAVILTTTESVQGYRIKEYRGIVRGVTVRQPTITQSWKANLKGIVGGKMSPFITMCESARQQAQDEMVRRAQEMGANAVVGLRYDSSAFGDQNDMGTEVVCYGTAVVIEPDPAVPQKSAMAIRDGAVATLYRY